MQRAVNYSALRMPHVGHLASAPDSHATTASDHIDRIVEAAWMTSQQCVHLTKLSLIRSERNGLL